MIGGLKKLLFGRNDAEEAVAAGAHADAALHHAAAPRANGCRTYIQ